MQLTTGPISLTGFKLLNPFCRPPSIHYDYTLRIRFFTPGLILPHLKARIEVTILGPDEHPVLSPEYLQIHATCVNVTYHALLSIWGRIL
jgi:hypothetical protein